MLPPSAIFTNANDYGCLLSSGINKLTKKLRKPNDISNQELLDFLSRAPNDFELVHVCMFYVEVYFHILLIHRLR